MPDPKLEEVFKLSGIPTFTFVRPLEYTKLLVSLRTPGRGLVIEGPSGIGKTTAVTNAILELGLEENITKLSARKREDAKQIAALPERSHPGVVIIDDFHRLDDSLQNMIADFLKVLADEEQQGRKLILVGINKAGDSLVNFAPDLNTRIDTLRFETNPDERVQELVTRGEKALNVELGTKPEIVAVANGSFYIAQMLCHETCIASQITEAQETTFQITNSSELVISRVMENLSRRFMPIAIRFARGTKLRREGRAPYLHILKWLAEANEWSISLDREPAKHLDQRASVGQVVDKGYLEGFINDNPELAGVLYYVPSTHVLTAEDPQFVFFLRNIPWNKFAEHVGYLNIHFQSRYDFALSFAGEDRPIAERLFQLLTESEFSVFYDRNEQSRILAENIEEYLAPIYRTEASYVVCLLGPQFPKKIWTRFESKQFEQRFREGAVIPIWFTTAPPGVFDESARVGGIRFDPDKDHGPQLQRIVELLTEKMRQTYADAAAKGPVEAGTG